MCTYSHISMVPFIFCPFLLPFLLIVCVNSKKRTSSKEQPTSLSTPVTTSVSQTSEEKDKSEKSTRSERRAADSLRVPRKAHVSNLLKSGKSTKSSKSGKSQRTEDDSARTEIIVVPIGKAAQKDSESHDIMTPADEQKGSGDSTKSRKVSFAESLRKVRHRGKKPDTADDELTNYIP